MTDNIWKQRLKDKMAHHSEPVPEGLWESIESRLPAETGAKPLREKAAVLWLKRISAAAACIAFALIVGKELLLRTGGAPGEDSLRPEDTLADIAAPDSAASLRPVTEPAPAADLIAAASSAAVTASPYASARPVLADNASPAARRHEPLAEAALLPIADDGDTAAADHRQPQPSEEAPETAAEARNDSRPHTAVRQQAYETASPAKASRASKPAGGRLTASLYTSGGVAGINYQHEGYITRIFSNNSLDYAPAGSASGTGNTAGGELANPSNSYDIWQGAYINGPTNPDNLAKDEEQNITLNDEYSQYREKIKHHMPLRTGFSLRYAVTDRLSVESGLTYTRLESEVSNGTRHNIHDRTQTLHYIGIPLNALYTLWRAKFLELYIVGGGMAEKNIKRSSTINYQVSGDNVYNNSDKRTEKPLQWSVNAGAGLQVNLNKAFGIYAELVMNYYIDNKSDVLNYYKEKQLNFNVKLGFRYSFNK